MMSMFYSSAGVRLAENWQQPEVSNNVVACHSRNRILTCKIVPWEQCCFKGNDTVQVSGLM